MSCYVPDSESDALLVACSDSVESELDSSVEELCKRCRVIVMVTTNYLDYALVCGSRL